MSASRGGAGPAVAVLGGMLLAWGGSAAWVQRTVVREVGGVPVREAAARAGTEFAPWALPCGVALLLAAAIAMAARGRGRALTGAALVSLGLGGIAAIAAGLAEALGAAGTLSAAPWMALAGGIAGVWGGVRALRRPRQAPLLDERYTVEGRDEEGEWSLASDEGDQPDGATA